MSKLQSQNMLQFLDMEHTSLPFYRTRTFWGIIFAILVIINIYLFGNLYNGINILESFKLTNIILGGIAPALVLQIFIGNSNAASIIATLISMLLVIYFFDKVFSKKSVSLFFATILLLNFVIGTALFYFLFGTYT